jgi:hypothetical protein
MTKGISIVSTGDFHTGENGSKEVFNVVLNAAPTAGRSVTLNFSSSDTTEGVILDDNSTFTFDSSNWNVAQRLTVHGINDFSPDGGVVYDIIGTVDRINSTAQMSIIAK